MTDPQNSDGNPDAPDDLPPLPDPLPDPPTFDPALYYDVTAADLTPTCPNYQRTFDVPFFYSNNGTDCRVECVVCGQAMRLLTAVLLEPQPVFP
jgi:hypothetical protein